MRLAGGIAWALLCSALAAWTGQSPPAAAPQPSKRFGLNERATRTIAGQVVNPGGQPVEGAVVYLEDVKSQQIRSYLTPAAGTFAFHGLSSEIEFHLRARHNGMTSKARAVTPFDSRREVTVTLRLDRKESPRKGPRRK